MVEGDVYKRRFNKYLLLKLEYLMGDNTVHLSGYKNISVEHVLPQNPNVNSEWRKKFSDEDRAEWTHKLANLVLISKRKNSRLSNLDYADKKEKYLNDRVDAFKGSKIFIESNLDWNKELLKDRQKKSINMLLENRYIR